MVKCMMSKKDLFIYIIAFLSLIFLFVDLSNVLFALLLSSLIFVLFTARVSIFSVVSIFITYVGFPVFFLENFGYNVGIIGNKTIPLFESEIYFALILFNIAVYFLCSKSKILDRENALYKMELNASKLFVYLCSAVVVIFTIIKFPTFGGERFNSLLPGESWNHFVIVGLVFLLFFLDKSWIARIAFLFSAIWFLLHGERVDMLGYFILLFLFYVKRKSITFTGKKIAIFSIIGVFSFWLLIVIGALRSGIDIDVKSLSMSVFVQPTAADIAYLINSSIYFTKTQPLFYGYTYLMNLTALIPLLDNPYLAQNILTNNYNAPGGEFYFSEAMLNFGYFAGMLFSVMVFIIVVLFIFKSKSKYLKIATLFLISAMPRIIWYGKHYVISGLTLFIPSLLIADYIIKRILKESEKEVLNNE